MEEASGESEIIISTYSGGSDYRGKLRDKKGSKRYERMRDYLMG